MASRFLCRSCFALVLWAVTVEAALAHFVWIEAAPSAAGLLVRSGFGEPGGWDPDLIDRIAKTQFWMLTSDGATKPIEIPLDKKEREYRTELTGPQPSAILASSDFGVIQFGANPPSWLRYTAKCLVGSPSAWSDSKPTESLRIELLATLDGDSVQLKALHLGKPLAGATIRATPPDGSRVELTTDDQGRARWSLAGAGMYGCYVGATTNEPGEQDGKAYAALKDYTTLTFMVPKS
jgi:hypothetical protein